LIDRTICCCPFLDGKKGNIWKKNNKKQKKININKQQNRKEKKIYCQLIKKEEAKTYTITINQSTQ
jgi:uncharacterized protein (DUF2344 family)